MTTADEKFFRDARIVPFEASETAETVPDLAEENQQLRAHVEGLRNVIRAEKAVVAQNQAVIRRKESEISVLTEKVLCLEGSVAWWRVVAALGWITAALMIWREFCR